MVNLPVRPYVPRTVQYRTVGGTTASRESYKTREGEEEDDGVYETITGDN